MESLIPSWAPNIHPLLVHFPIAVLITATLADVASLVWTKDWLKKMVMALFSFGVIMLLITYLSGKQAIDLVDVPLKAELTASHHADWALRTLLFYGAYLIARIFAYFSRFKNRKWIAIVLLLAGLAGIGLITKTGDFGGKLVYYYQVGTRSTDEK